MKGNWPRLAQSRFCASRERKSRTSAVINAAAAGLLCTSFGCADHRQDLTVNAQQNDEGTRKYVEHNISFQPARIVRALSKKGLISEQQN